MPVARLLSSFSPFMDPLSLAPNASENVLGKILGAFRWSRRHKWDLSDRRSHLRHTCALEALLHKGADSLPMTVLDLSLTGMRVRVGDELTPGQSVSISDGQGLEVSPCRVEWVREGQAGLSFLRPATTAKADWLTRQGGSELLDSKTRPQALRVECKLGASLVVENKVRRVKISELGTGGATIEGEGEPLKDGARVRLDFGSGGSFGRVVLDCQVVSMEEGSSSRYGLRFLRFYKGTGGELSAYLDYFLSKGAVGS